VIEPGTIEWALTTTRAVRRRLDLDRDVDVEVVLDCLDLALQAPTGGNAQGWRWIVITQPATKAKIRDIYVDALGAASGGRHPDRTGSSADQMLDDAWHLATHLDRIPVLVVACIRGRLTLDSTLAQATALLGSIYPAVWSLQLALRSRGLASVMTTVHLQRREAMAELLGIPDDVTQAALVPIAHLLGDELRPARRRPVRDVAFPDHWGAAWEALPGPPAGASR
jgi:nitroreductase